MVSYGLYLLWTHSLTLSLMNSLLTLTLSWTLFCELRLSLTLTCILLLFDFFSWTLLFFHGLYIVTYLLFMSPHSLLLIYSYSFMDSLILLITLLWIYSPFMYGHSLMDSLTRPYFFMDSLSY